MHGGPTSEANFGVYFWNYVPLQMQIRVYIFGNNQNFIDSNIHFIYALLHDDE